MREVSVTVNGREFTIACGEGEEDHLIRLATFVDQRVRELSRSVGPQAGELRLLLMASLVIVDKCFDADKKIERLRSEAAKAKESAASELSAMAPVVDTVARRIEDIAVLLESS